MAKAAGSTLLPASIPNGRTTCLRASTLPPAVRERRGLATFGGWTEGKGAMMRTLLILTAIIGLSASAFAQTAAPKGGKAMKQAKPSAPMGCKLVGTVKGTKLWAGDCGPVSELRGTVPAPEPEAPAPTPEANPPAAKQ